MIGVKIGKLTVIKDDPSAAANVITKCECGRERSIKRGELNRQKKKAHSAISCGICTYEKYGQEMLHKKYDHLTVTEFRIIDGTFNKTVEVLCTCECGTSDPFWWKAADLRQGRKKACGLGSCPYVRRHTRNAPKSKHGEHQDPKETSILKRWRNMHDRCYNKNHGSFKHYGEKNIGVDYTWHKDNVDGYRNYRTWYLDQEAQAKKDGKDVNFLTVDRKDGTLGYSEANCRLADKSTQSANQDHGKSKNIFNHIDPHNRPGTNILMGNRVALGFEYVEYVAYLPLTKIPKYNAIEGLILLHYIKTFNRLDESNINKIPSTIEILNSEETKKYAKYHIEAKKKFTEEGKRYKSRVSHYLVEGIPIGYRCAKIAKGDKVFISTIAYPVETLKLMNFFNSQ